VYVIGTVNDGEVLLRVGLSLEGTTLAFKWLSSTLGLIEDVASLVSSVDGELYLEKRSGPLIRQVI